MCLHQHGETGDSHTSRDWYQQWHAEPALLSTAACTRKHHSVTGIMHAWHCRDTFTLMLQTTGANSTFTDSATGTAVETPSTSSTCQWQTQLPSVWSVSVT
jgi:hypothetical protein